MARTPLMAGNWKMNLNHLEALALVQKLAFSLTDEDYDAVEVAVLPPFTDIRSVQTLVDGDKYRIGYGAQDVSPHDPGAHTGDIAASMLAKLGCSYVVVGHSERRADHGEDDALVNAKVKAAWPRSSPRSCASASRWRSARRAATSSTRLGQLARRARRRPGRAGPASSSSPTSRSGPSAPARSPPPRTRRRSAPRSAPGLAELYSGDLADGVRILYGGSVRPPTWPAIMAQADVDGALVGGASIDAEEFVGIVRYRNAADQLEGPERRGRS